MRLLVLGLAGLVVLAAAIWLARQETAVPLSPQQAVTPPPAPPEQPRTASPAPAPLPAPTPSAPGPQAQVQPDPPARQPLAVRPSFDVVRVGARGDVVMAGRAAAGAEVIILDGVTEIGRARADGRGEWAFVSANPLRPGGRELTLRARHPDGTETEASSTVVLIVPEAERDVAGQPAQGPAAAPLALLAPRDGQGELRVLQAPQPQVQAEPPAPAVPQPPQAVAPQAAVPQVAVPQAVAPQPAQPAAPPAPQLAQPAAPALSPAATPAPRPAPPAPAPAVTAVVPSPSHAPASPPTAPPPPPGPAPTAPQAVAEAPRPAPSQVPAGRPAAGVSVDVVDYGDTGEVRFAGRAGPGGAVRLYLDNRHIGDAAADPEGRWNLSPEAPIEPGLFELRADQVDPAGRVTARVQLPFQRSAAPPEALREGSIVVQPGQNLWRISRQTYGRGVHYTVIYGANRDAIRDPNLIFPGQVFSLPPNAPAQPRRR